MGERPSDVVQRRRRCSLLIHAILAKSSNVQSLSNWFSIARQTFIKRREDILDEFEETTATSLLQEYTEQQKSYVVSMYAS